MGVLNKNRLIAYINGIQGVNAGGQASINLPCNGRYHRITLNVTNGGVAAAVSSVITAIKLVVNGVPVRDIAPADIIRIAQSQGYYPALGELPIFFTEPYARTVPAIGDLTSWDMSAQSSFQIFLTIAGGTTPGVTGTYEYDFLRNLLPDGKTPFLNVVAMHQYTYNMVVGKNPIVNLPFPYPIRRLWLKAATAGGISELEVTQDGNLIHQSLYAQAVEQYSQYGFLFSQLNAIPWVNATGPAALGVAATKEAITYYDYAYIADIDRRTDKALFIDKQLIVNPTSANAEALTVTIESLPGGYLG